MKWTRLELALLALFAAFLATVPWVVPIVADQFWVVIISEILIWSLLAASVNLLFGYVGLLSFGQALYFGMGMYGVAIGIAKLGLSFWPAFGFGIVLAIAMAAIAGVFAVRLTWHYFAIITVVFSLIFYFLAMTMKPLTGGDDGTTFSLPPMLTWGDEEYGLTDPTIQYFFILVCVAACFYLKYRVVGSPFGRALVAIRENDTRAALIGLNVYLLRLAAFVFA
ncbi:MAG TPA: branched-chain amino acid ABC transporter permease, partial [Burkholderiaceae bacterium]|nr:branched-chain amino acid ABC transporter permease [Burkholderiaceae bacterium]